MKTTAHLSPDVRVWQALANAGQALLDPCGTARECEQAGPIKWVCFNPHVMFPGAKLPEAFPWFCHWTFEVSKRGPGKKVLFVDDLWQWVTNRKDNAGRV